MRKLALLSFLAVSASAFAAKPVTVAELEQVLAAAHGKSDTSVADRLSELTLTERASSANLLRWESDLPGGRAREAMIALVDASAFLNLPASEIPSTPPPPLATQTQILSRTIGYVSQTLPKLPNFLATRETAHFEDRSQAQLPSSRYSSIPLQMRRSFEDPPLHVIGRSSVGVTYHDGHEIVETQASHQKNEPLDAGFTTRGEFGPILGLVLADAVRSHISWGHWEQDTTGPLAVFRYTVPQSNSHYMVTFPFEERVQQQLPAYHGEITVNPANGNIMRLTVISDLQPPYQTVETAIMVEYAPVDIGGTTYICPVRGVALSRMPLPRDTAKPQTPAAPRRTQINDLAFTHYHIFRAESRILIADKDAPEESPSPTATPASAVIAASDAAPLPGAAATEQLPSTSPQPQPVISDAAVPAQPAPPAAEQAQASSTPPVPSSPISASNATPVVLHAKANIVLLDVVVTNRDKAVHGLDRSRFHIFEDGREQSIATFDEHHPTPTPAATAIVLPPNTYTNLPTYPQTGPINILLLDSLNTPLLNQAEVRRQMLQYLGKLPPGTSLAIFTLSSRLRMVSGFTTDVAPLIKALQSSKAAPQSSTVLDTETGSSLSAAAAHLANSDSSDPATLAAVISMLQFAADIKTHETDERVRLTLTALQQLAHYLSAVPGRKNLIWFSGSFPLALGTDDPTSASSSADPLKNMRGYADDLRHTSETLSTARVAVYPVDARGVMALPSSNAAYVASANLMRGNPAAQGTASVVNRPDISNDNFNFSIQTAAEHASMYQLAEETGGHAYVNTNGLREAAEKAVENGSSYYTIGYVPSDKKLDGQFRKIRLRLDDAGYQLAYRPGYYADTSGKPVNDGPAAANPANPMTASTLLGAPPSTQILFQARVLPATDPQLQSVKLEEGPAGELSASLKQPVHRYVADLAVDPHNLTFEELPDGTRRTQVELALVAYDVESRRVNYVDRGLQMTMKPEQYAHTMATGLPFHLAIDLPAGQLALRIAVHDSASGNIGSVEIPLAVATK
jgi:VWFA-related protein